MFSFRFTLFFSLAFMLSFSTIAQDPVDYSVRVASISSDEGGIFGACYEPTDNWYDYLVSVRDDVNTTPSGPDCFTCSAPGDCTTNPNTVVRSESSSGAVSVIINFAGMEDDNGEDGNCIIQGGDDCICGPQDVATIDFRNDPESQWNSYGPFGCGSHEITIEIFYETTAPLPVELVEFKGFSKNEINQLEWTTASEYNTQLFEVQYSNDGDNWQLIDEVKAEGYSDAPITYAYQDLHPTSKSYYRLNAVDFNGTQEYSDVVFIENNNVSKASPIQKIYPNPSQQSFILQFSEGDFEKDLDLSVINTVGRVVEQYRLSSDLLSDGNWTLDLNNHPDGLYFISVRDAKGSIYTERIQKIK